MQGKIEGIQESIDSIEKNLTRELDIEDIASIAALSPSYYQRIFGALCGMTVGEYIRARRMSLAAQDLSREDVKVIDIANRYCYDSPDSFAKTFQKFHGITPSQARETGASLKSFAPLHIKITMEGGTMLDYRIVEKSSFTIFGIKRRFNSDTSYQDIPKFWDEYKEMGANRPVKGTFGICVDVGGKDSDYWIADLYEPGNDIPEECEAYQIPESIWAQFVCNGQSTDDLQNLNTRIWSEWLPSLKGYELAGKYNIEVYGSSTDNAKDKETYIWIPLRKI